MTISNKWYLVLGALVPLFCMGLLWFCWAISGMRRGNFHCKYGWLHKGNDGWLFWAVTFTFAGGGLGLMVVSIYLGLRALT